MRTLPKQHRAFWAIGLALSFLGASAQAELRIEGPTLVPEGAAWVELRAVDSASGSAQGAAGSVSRVDWAGTRLTSRTSLADRDGALSLKLPARAKAGERYLAEIFDGAGTATRHAIEIIRADAPAYAIYGLNINGRFDDALYPMELATISFIVGNVGAVPSAGGQITVTSNSPSVEIMNGLVTVPRLESGERAEITGLQVRLSATADIAEALELRFKWQTQENVEGAALRKLRVTRAVLGVKIDFGNPANPDEGGVLPGSDGEFYLTLANLGNDPIREGTLSVRGLECAEPLTSSLVLPALAPGATSRIAASIRVRVPTQCVDGSGIKLALEGEYLGQMVWVPLSSPISFPAGLIRVVEQTATIATPIAVPDGNAAGASSAHAVVPTGVLRSLAVSVRITHPFVGNLRVKLVHPDGTEVVLHERTGGSADNLYLTYGDGGKAVPALSGFAGKPVQGSWKLVVIDLSAGNVGTIDAFSLKLRGYIAP